MHLRQLSIAAPGGCVAVGLALWLATAQAALVTATLVAEDKDEQLSEKHDPEVKVSGNVVVGVMLTSAYQGLSADKLAVSPGEALVKDTICLQVTSRDGAYTSRNNYTVGAADQEDTVQLPYDSRYPDVVAEYDDKGALAVTATRGGCEQSGRNTYYLPYRLNDQNTQPAPPSWRAFIYINGFDATDVYYTFEGGKGKLHDCAYIEEGRHTAFNFICELRSGDIPADAGGALALKMLREVYGRELEPITIEISGLP